MCEIFIVRYQFNDRLLVLYLKFEDTSVLKSQGFFLCKLVLLISGLNIYLHTHFWCVKHVKSIHLLTLIVLGNKYFIHKIYLSKAMHLNTVIYLTLHKLLTSIKSTNYHYFPNVQLCIFEFTLGRYIKYIYIILLEMWNLVKRPRTNYMEIWPLTNWLKVLYVVVHDMLI